MTVPFLEALGGDNDLVMVELRPPRAGLDGAASMDAWIDSHHAVGRLHRAGRFVLLTDDAVGQLEEENLSHLEGNLAGASGATGVIPFLTCKHPLEYCLVYAERAWARGLRAITVVGGDRAGAPRCLPHAFQLRNRIRQRVRDLSLGGWVNPHRDPVEQARFLADAEAETDFYLSQDVSDDSAGRVERFLEALATCDVRMPGVFGVFYYRSPDPGTLKQLGRYFPVPADSVRRAFRAGASPEELCARSLRALRDAGARHLYVSNLPVRSAASTLERVLRLL